MPKKGQPRTQPTCQVGQLLYDAAMRLDMGSMEVIRELNKRGKQQGINYDRSAWAKWMTGTIPRPDARRHLEDILKIPPATLANVAAKQEKDRFPPPEPTQEPQPAVLYADALPTPDGLAAGTSGEDVRRREFALLTLLGIAGLPGVAWAPRLALELARHGLGEGAVTADWHSIVSQYGRDYMTASPANLLDSLLVDAASLQVTMNEARANQRRELQSAGALLAHFAALTLGNLGRLWEADRWWRTANRLAAESADVHTIVWVKGSELGRAFYEARPYETLAALAEEADSMTRNAPPASITELLVGKTQVLTVLGRKGDSEATLERFREVVSRLPAIPDHENASWFAWAENRLLFAESFVHSYQGNVRETNDMQRRAATLYPSWYRRGPMKIGLQHALAMIRSGDVAGGIGHAHAIVSELGTDGHDWPVIGFWREILQGVPPGEHEGIVARFRKFFVLPDDTNPQQN